MEEIQKVYLSGLDHLYTLFALRMTGLVEIGIITST